MIKRGCNIYPSQIQKIKKVQYLSLPQLPAIEIAHICLQKVVPLLSLPPIWGQSMDKSKRLERGLDVHVPRLWVQHQTSQFASHQMALLIVKHEANIHMSIKICQLWGIVEGEFLCLLERDLMCRVTSSLSRHQGALAFMMGVTDCKAWSEYFHEQKNMPIVSYRRRRVLMPS